ncbi:beta-propeller fold lactonase family protein [Paenibacillus sp. CF384]|uniref:beta-propeller fold lactonase family protein n=1 Tax=Paenibacillus sp. CF384 TaxID=1884382 RepID=UPI00089B27B8|nr:YncE family protein [Paenibacillus sp. CF384]SDW85013.1 40-residue YVTN family beta-propeller repeat-containing protein [Paenibacillus sp. CF384]
MPNYAYVAQSNSKVAIVDTDTNVVVSTIVIGFNTNWIALTPDAKTAYLANQTNSTVAVLDLMSEIIVGVIYLGITNNQANQPKQIIVHPTNGLAYIANVSGTISIIDTAALTLLSTVIVASGLSVMALSPDTNYLYIGTGPEVSVFSTITNTVIDNIPLPPPLQAGDLALTPDGSLVYVASPGTILTPDNKVASLSTITRAAIATVTVGTRPVKVNVNPLGTQVYVVNQDSHNVSVIDIASNTIVITIPISGTLAAVQALTPDGSRDFVSSPSLGRLLAIDTTTSSPINVFIGGVPTGLAVTSDGSKVLATVAGTFIAVVNTQTNTLITQIGLDASATFITIPPQISPVQQRVHTTGIIMNTEDDVCLAKSVSVNVLNESYLQAAIIEIIGFAIPSTPGPKITIAHYLYLLPPNTADMKKVTVLDAGAYEIQIKASTLYLADVVLSLNGLDSEGNVIPEQRELQAGLTVIRGLSYAP